MTTSFDPPVSEEIGGITLAGFFSYGSIVKSRNGQYEYYTNTCCLLALKEIEN